MSKGEVSVWLLVTFAVVTFGVATVSTVQESFFSERFDILDDTGSDITGPSDEQENQLPERDPIFGGDRSSGANELQWIERGESISLGDDELTFFDLNKGLTHTLWFKSAKPVATTESAFSVSECSTTSRTAAVRPLDELGSPERCDFMKPLTFQAGSSNLALCEYSEQRDAAKVFVNDDMTVQEAAEKCGRSVQDGSGSDGSGSSGSGGSGGGIMGDSKLKDGLWDTRFRSDYPGVDSYQDFKSRVDGYEQWMGDDLELLSEGTGACTWLNWEQRDWYIEYYDQWLNEDESHQFLLSTGFFPDWSCSTADGSGNPDLWRPGSDQSRRWLKRCVNGDFDSHYEALAQRLVDAGMEDIILRPAAEQNLAVHADTAIHHPDLWAQCFDRFAETVNSVDDAEFKIMWNPSNGRLRGDIVRQSWPGPENVDYIGVDFYDRSTLYAQNSDYPDGMTDQEKKELRADVWERKATDKDHLGLSWFVEKSNQHGIPFAFAEWGSQHQGPNLAGEPKDTYGLDNPYHIQKAYKFAMECSNNVAFQAYFQGSNGAHDLKENPDLADAGQRFKQTFGKENSRDCGTGGS